jgi:terminase large subunit-like protein
VKALSISQVLTDPRLLGSELSGGSWSTWLTTLKAAFGLPLDDDERAVFKTIAGDRSPPTSRVRELWVAASRRSGKSRMAAALACYFALFVKHKLSAGERGMVLVLAMSMDQAQTVFSYALAFLRNSSVLAKEIDTFTRSEIRLRNGITISIHSNSFRSVRGRTLCACIFDEVAYWRDDTTATPDTETYTAVLPSLLTTNGMLIGISSPYRRTGLLHNKHKQYFGVDSDDTLVVQGSTLTFNKTLNEQSIAAQQAADPTASRSEWLGEFRDDLVGFLDDAIIDAAIDRDRPLELPPQPGIFYRAYVDVSGGAVGGDAYTISVAHKDLQSGRLIIDVVRGRSGPFDPQILTEEYADLCKQYRVGSVNGDYYSAEWSSSAWQKTGTSYIRSLLTASAIYLEALPLFTRQLVSLPDHPTLLRELRLLERSPTKMGKDQVTHPRGQHDDFANAVCGALNLIGTYLGYDLHSGAFDDGPYSVVDDPVAKFQRERAAKANADLMKYAAPANMTPHEYRQAKPKEPVK